MNIAENLVRLQQRLIDRRAKPQTIAMVDKYISLAERAGGSEHSSQLKVLHRLMRSPDASQDTSIYNDLVGLEEELQAHREEQARERETLESRPMLKPKKFYQQQRDCK